MSKKTLGILVPSLAILLALLVIGLLIVPFQYAWRGNYGPYILNVFGFFKSKSAALHWYNYEKGGDYHFIQIIIQVLGGLSIALAVGLLAVAITLFILKDNKVLKTVLLALVIATIAVTSIIFAGSIAIALVTKKYGNEIKLFTPALFAPILAVSVLDLVFLAKLKKAQ